MSKYDLVVIGGGSAGLVVAGGAAQLGARVALVDKNLSGYKKWLSYYFKIWR